MQPFGEVFENEMAVRCLVSLSIRFMKANAEEDAFGQVLLVPMQEESNPSADSACVVLLSTQRF
jgi:hypothetical protein